MIKKLILCIVLFFILSGIPSYAETPTLPYKTQILPYNYISLAGTDQVLRKVILCESGGYQTAIGKAGEVGLLQYMPSTWELWTSKMNKDLDINNPSHQIEVYKWAINNGYSRHWTCWRKIFGIN